MDDWKVIILARYCGQFRPADDKTANIRKTSEQIVIDLRPAGSFFSDEVSEYLVGSGYSIGFDDNTPVWLMRDSNDNELPEH